MFVVSYVLTCKWVFRTKLIKQKMITDTNERLHQCAIVVWKNTNKWQSTEHRWITLYQSVWFPYKKISWYIYATHLPMNWNYVRLNHFVWAAEKISKARNYLMLLHQAWKWFLCTIWCLRLNSNIHSNISLKLQFHINI